MENQTFHDQVLDLNDNVKLVWIKPTIKPLEASFQITGGPTGSDESNNGLWLS